MQDTRTKKVITLENYGRHQVVPRVIFGNQMTYQKNDQLYSFNIRNQKKNNHEISETEPLVTLEKGEMVIYNHNSKSKLQPLGEGHYIWPSLSPDKERLLFTKTGDGTYISDLAGDIKFSLGYANDPKWSPDGKWIVYMVDKDDGHQYLSSEIYITDIKGQNRVRITEGKSIDMYPTWSPDGNKIAFHTNQGDVYLVHLKFEEGDQ
jgi:Tol biopolymer transport system component